MEMIIGGLIMWWVWRRLIRHVNKLFDEWEPEINALAEEFKRGNQTANIDHMVIIQPCRCSHDAPAPCSSMAGTTNIHRQ